MSIIKRVPLECECPGKPNPKEYGFGSIWECDNQDCRKHWEINWDQRDRSKFWMLKLQNNTDCRLNLRK